MKWIPKPWHPPALDFALSRPHAALWMKMGLGKTAVAATAIAHRMDAGEVARTLIVGPVRVVESVWPAELEKWDHLRDIPWRLVRGSMKRRAAMLDEPWYGIELITYETLTWTFRDWGKKHRWCYPWQMVVYDEVSKLKAVNTARFRAMRQRRADGTSRCQFPYVLELTGSPAPAGLAHIWAPIFLMDQGERLGRVYNNQGEGFIPRWFMPAPTGHGHLPRPHAAKQIHDRIEDLTLAMEIEDYVDDLPSLTETDILVELHGRQRAEYDKLEDEMFLALEGGDIEAMNGGVLTMKTRQYANGAMYLDKKGSWELVHDYKLAALADVVEEMEGGNLIVAYQFKSDLERLKKAYPRAATLEDPRTAPRVIEEWNEGLHPMLLIHPASAGHGLNLQDGGDSICMFGLGWSYDQYEQTVARIAGGLRRKRPTFVYRILARDTIDEVVLEVLKSRRTVQDVLMERMKSRESQPMTLEVAE